MTNIQNSLNEKIAALEEIGADRFDPVRFCYIRSLARRINNKSGPVFTEIEQKLLTAITEYRKNFDDARIEAEEAVNRICADSPDNGASICRLFKNNEFREVLRLGRRLHGRYRRTDLSDLTDQVLRLSKGFTEENHPVSVEDQLRKQEQDILASIDASPAGSEPVPPSGNTESRSIKRFKETIMKMHSDRLVTRSIQDCPENAGPHNAQMMAINTFSTLLRIAPGYLNRFISHIDTLIRLKQAGDDMGKTKGKRTGS